MSNTTEKNSEHSKPVPLDCALGACCDQQELYVEQDDEDGYFSIRCYNCGAYPHHTAYLVWNDADDVIKQLTST